MHDASLGMLFLHKKGVYHGDLKPHNMLINEKDTLAISDFGLSRMKEVSSSLSSANQVVSRGGGTPPYMAPELVRGQGFYESDVYSFSICMLEVLTQTRPWGITSRPQYKAVQGERPLLPSNCKVTWYIDLIKACWSQEVSKRPSFHKIVEIFEENERNLT